MVGIILLRIFLHGNKKKKFHEFDMFSQVSEFQQKGEKNKGVLKNFNNINNNKLMFLYITRISED